MQITTIISLLTAFGVGSIVSALIQNWIAGKSKLEARNFEEKKAAYVGLLQAYHNAAVEGTDRAAKEFALWQMRCELVAPRPVRQAIQKIVDTNEDQEARFKAHEALKEEFRKDLGISK